MDSVFEEHFKDTGTVWWGWKRHHKNTDCNPYGPPVSTASSFTIETFSIPRLGYLRVKLLIQEIHGAHAADKVENANRRKELDDLITDTQERLCWLYVNVQKPQSEHAWTHFNRFYNSVMRSLLACPHTHTQRHTPTRAACVFFVSLSLYLRTHTHTSICLYMSLQVSI